MSLLSFVFLCFGVHRINTTIHVLTLCLLWTNIGLHVYINKQFSVKFEIFSNLLVLTFILEGAQWLSGGVLDSRPRGRGFEPNPCHCVVSLSKTH